MTERFRYSLRLKKSEWRLRDGVISTQNNYSPLLNENDKNVSKVNNFLNSQRLVIIGGND